MRSAAFDRAEVIEKITNAFWEHGYEATSIQVLEAATGLKRQSLYNAFGNKEAMFQLAADHYNDSVSQKLMARLQQDDPRTALRDFFRMQVEILLDDERPAGCFVAGGQQELANRDAALGEQMSALIDEQYGGLVEVFENWRAAGKLKPDADPEALAAIVMTQVRGQAVLGRSPRARKLIRRAAETIPSLFEPYLT